MKVYELYEIHRNDSAEINNMETNFRTVGLYSTEDNGLMTLLNEINFQVEDNEGWRYSEIQASEELLQSSNFIKGYEVYYLGEDREIDFDNDEWAYQIVLRELTLD